MVALIIGRKYLYFQCGTCSCRACRYPVPCRRKPCRYYLRYYHKPKFLVPEAFFVVSTADRRGKSPNNNKENKSSRHHRQLQDAPSAKTPPEPPSRRRDVPTRERQFPSNNVQSAARGLPRFDTPGPSGSAVSERLLDILVRGARPPRDTPGQGVEGALREWEYNRCVR